MTQYDYEELKAEVKKTMMAELFKTKKRLVNYEKAIYDYAFDRAYALGMQEKDAEDGSLWSRLTDDEKRELQCRYHTNECVLRDHKKRTGDKAQSKAVARMKLLENLFGIENIKTHNNG